MADNSWIGSLDVNDWVQKLLTSEVQQLKNASQKQIAQETKIQDALKTQLSNYGTVNNYFQTLSQDFASINTAFSANTYNLTVADTTIATVQSQSQSGNLTPGTHTLVVSQLAQASSTASTTSYQSTTGQANLSETLNISIGNPSSPSASFGINVAATDSLQTICDNINLAAKANNAGAFASIIQTGSGSYQLVVSSTQLGLDNAVNLSESGSSTLGMTKVLTTAQNASFTYDNLTFASDTNNVSVGAMNVSLIKQGSTTINVVPNSQTASVMTAIQQMVTDYNQFDKFIETTQAANMSADSTLSLVLDAVQNALGSAFSGTGNPYNNLASVGVTSYYSKDSIPITYNDDKKTVGECFLLGQLQVDTTTLTNALNNNFSAVQQLLCDSQAGILTKASQQLAQDTGSIWNILNLSTTGSVAQVNTRIGNAQLEIDKTTRFVDSQTKVLIQKYAELDTILSKLQGQDQYVSQQVSMWGHNNS
jgi:flagellar hook-associated protein 2